MDKMSPEKSGSFSAEENSPGRTESTGSPESLGDSLELSTPISPPKLTVPPLKRGAPPPMMTFMQDLSTEETEAPSSPHPESGELTPLGRGLAAPEEGIPLYNSKQVKYLANGAFGKTFKVTPDKGSPFVIKEIEGRMDPHETQANIHAREEKLQIEMKTMKRVNGHPNIASFLGSDKTEHGNLRIAVSLAPGKALNAQKLSEKKTKLAMRQLLGALQHCHSKGVAHLDVKPENLLWDSKKSQLTLVDFGEARLMDSENQINQNMSAGTARYRSQFKSETDGTKVDTYAAGKTCEALLQKQGEIPPEAQTFIDQCLKGKIPIQTLLEEDPWLNS